jgi:ketosteroid isomerase-like protein
MLKCLKIRGGIVMNNAIAAVLNSWFEAYKKGDVDSVVAHHTDNASLFAPGAPRVDDTEALKATIQGMIDGGITYISHETTEADSREDIGYLLANITLAIPDTGNVSAKVVDVLKRQSDGTWKFHNTCWNLDS